MMPPEVRGIFCAMFGSIDERGAPKALASYLHDLTEFENKVLSINTVEALEQLQRSIIEERERAEEWIYKPFSRR